MTSPFDTIWTRHQPVAGWTMAPGATARNPVRGWWAEFVAPPQGPPVMAATATMTAPTLREIATPPVMTATGKLVAPAVGSGSLIASPTLTAAAALIAPAVAELLSAPALSAGAVLRIPALANILPAPALSAAAAMPAPTINTGTAISPPKLTATAAMVTPTIGIGTAILPPLLTAAAVMAAPTLAELILPPRISAAGLMPAPAIVLITPLAFDAVGGNGSTGGLGAATASETHNAVAGATVTAFAIAPSGKTVTGITLGGVAMSFVGSVPMNNNTALGIVYVYEGIAPGGPKTVTATYSASVGGALLGSVSYTGVSNVGAPITAFGSSAAPSQALTCSPGQIIVQAFGCTGSANMTSPTGGNNRIMVNVSSTANARLDISDSPANATFGVTLSASSAWGAIGVILS
jgi:hypothetical protein